MPIPSHIFRSYDIRGLLDEVTPEVAEKSARALVRMTGAKKILVGRDMRETSPMLASVVMEALLSCGVHVEDIGMCTTSLFNYAVTSRNDVDAGVMVTASHNPAQYNGLKFARANGLPIAGADIFANIEDKQEVSVNRGEKENGEVVESYLSYCQEKAGTSRMEGKKIVIDYGNGMGALTLSPLCKRLGMEVVELYPEPDSRFPNHEANPAKEETLHDLKRKILEVDADVGVALDGDADRIGFVDNEGSTVFGDLTLALMAQAMLEKHPHAKVLYSINASWAVEDSVQEMGGIPVACPVGRTKVIERMGREQGILGGEVSSHFFFPEFHNLESVDYAFLTVLNIWKNSGKTFADLVRPLRKYFNSQEMNYEVEDKDGAIAALKNAYEASATKCITIDGIRFEFNRDWWMLVRKSNTEPLLRVTIEASSAELLEEKKKEVLEHLSPFVV